MTKRLLLITLTLSAIGLSGCRSTWGPMFPPSPLFYGATGVAVVAANSDSIFLPPYTVTAVITPSQERFTGTGQQARLGRNYFSMSSDRGTHCTGRFKERRVEEDGSVQYGNGELNCDDARNGVFLVTGTAQEGTGKGQMNNGSLIEFHYIVVPTSKEK